MNNKSSIVKLIAVLQQIVEEMAESDINTSSNHNEEVVEMLTISPIFLNIQSEWGMYLKIHAERYFLQG